MRNASPPRIKNAPLTFFPRRGASEIKAGPVKRAGKGEEKKEGIPLRSVRRHRKIREIRRYYGELPRRDETPVERRRGGSGGYIRECVSLCVYV